MHESTSWIYGDEAFGLRFASWFGRNISHQLLMILSITLARFRRISINSLTSVEIKQCAELAEKTLALSFYFRSILEQFPELKQKYTPNKLKKCFSDSQSKNAMIQDLQGI